MITPLHPQLFYTTPFGEAYLGDSLVFLPQIESESIDLILTSPPFALKRKKEYGGRFRRAAGRFC
jgi:site-specific DNA-methyltransferase (cytosine-N4-specific)